jgi:hypothetical protein
VFGLIRHNWIFCAFSCMAWLFDLMGRLGGFVVEG